MAANCCRRRVSLLASRRSISAIAVRMRTTSLSSVLMRSSIAPGVRARLDEVLDPLAEPGHRAVAGEQSLDARQVAGERLVEHALVEHELAGQGVGRDRARGRRGAGGDPQLHELVELLGLPHDRLHSWWSAGPPRWRTAAGRPSASLLALSVGLGVLDLLLHELRAHEVDRGVVLLHEGADLGLDRVLSTVRPPTLTVTAPATFRVSSTPTMPSVTTFLAEILATPSTVYVASRPRRCLATSSLHSAPGAVEVAVIVEMRPSPWRSARSAHRPSTRRQWRPSRC